MQDRRNGSVVAVKVVPKGRLRPDQLERIRREYSIMNQVPTTYGFSLCFSALSRGQEN